MDFGKIQLVWGGRRRGRCRTGCGWVWFLALGSALTLSPGAKPSQAALRPGTGGPALVLDVFWDTCFVAVGAVMQCVFFSLAFASQLEILLWISSQSSDFRTTKSSMINVKKDTWKLRDSHLRPLMAGKNLFSCWCALRGMLNRDTQKGLACRMRTCFFGYCFVLLCFCVLY